MAHNSRTRLKLIGGPASARWPLAAHISQDSFEHPLLPCELWFLSSFGTVQSVHVTEGKEGRRAEAAHLEDASGFSPYPLLSLKILPLL